MTTPEPSFRVAFSRGAAFADLVRLHAARLPLAAFLLTAVGTSRSSSHLAGGSLLILASYGAAAAYNDGCDVEVDRANRRRRPLATGALHGRDARNAEAVCIGLVLAAQVLLDQPLGLLVTAAALVAAVAYSHPAVGLERRGLWGTAMLAVSYLVLPVVLAGSGRGPAVLVALVAGGTATLLYKDVKDEVGDRLLGKRTPLVRWGARRMDGVAAVLGGAAAAIGVVSAGPGWWTAASVAGLGGQLAMAATGARRGPLLTVHRLLACAGLVGLAAAA